MSNDKQSPNVTTSFYSKLNTLENAWLDTKIFLTYPP